MTNTSPLPPLPYSDWVDTKETLHLFAQIVGKIRLKTHPKLNHWWHVVLYPAATGLTTSRIPYGDGAFEVQLDLFGHEARVLRDDGRTETVALPGLSVADFHDALFGALHRLGVAVAIVGRPYDNKSVIPFAEDQTHAAYDPDAVRRFGQALGWIAGVFERHRGRFVGKQTPVQLYWHSFDLVTTRFSGRAHPMTGGTASDREAYSHEVISAGFWPGDDTAPAPAFYAYAYPEPAGISAKPLAPATAVWVEKNGGALAILPYDALRASADPAGDLLLFLDHFYQTAGALGGWPLDALAHAAVSP